MKAADKCREILACERVTEGRRSHITNYLRLIELCPAVYPNPQQTRIINSLYKEYCESEVEKQAKEWLGIS